MPGESPVARIEPKISTISDKALQKITRASDTQIPMKKNKTVAAKVKWAAFVKI